jgi:catechol 2,3-dioxygenase-like lactoylglutathione lyase family enzyme
MNPHITVITLGVQDLQRSVDFYRGGLGLPTQGIVGEEFEDGAVAFFKLDSGLILALYPHHALNKDAGLDTAPPTGIEPSVGFSLAHNVGSKDAVDQVMAQATAAGATIAKAAYERVWGGYTGYFRDPDGHLWEIAWNPGGFGDDPRERV